MNLNPIESEIKEILSLLWAEAEEGYLALCSIKPGDIKSEFSDLSKENAIDMAVQKAKSTVINEFNSYHTLGLLKVKPDGGRGEESNVMGIPGLWTDIDINTGTHEKTDLPNSTEEALDFLKTFPLYP